MGGGWGVQATGENSVGTECSPCNTWMDWMNVTSVHATFFYVAWIALTNKKQQCFVEMLVLRLYRHAQRFVGQNWYFEQMENSVWHSVKTLSSCALPWYDIRIWLGFPFNKLKIVCDIDTIWKLHYAVSLASESFAWPFIEGLASSTIYRHYPSTGFKLYFSIGGNHFVFLYFVRS